MFYRQQFCRNQASACYFATHVSVFIIKRIKKTYRVIYRKQLTFCLNPTGCSKRKLHIFKLIQVIVFLVWYITLDIVDWFWIVLVKEVFVNFCVKINWDTLYNFDSMTKSGISIFINRRKNEARIEEVMRIIAMSTLIRIVDSIWCTWILTY